MGTTTIDNVNYNYSSGTFTIVQPSASHNEIHMEITDLFVVGFIYIDDNIALNTGLYLDPSNSIRDVINRMKTELENKNIYYNIKLDLLLHELVIEIERLKNASNSEFDEFSYIKKFIDENLSQEISISKLAQISGYSYHYFRHIFKEKIGLSPIKYVMNKRIQKAKLLLATTEASIAYIAQECGFSNNSQLTISFQNVTNMSPSEYRRYCHKSNK